MPIDRDEAMKASLISSAGAATEIPTAPPAPRTSLAPSWWSSMARNASRKVAQPQPGLPAASIAS